MSVSFLRLKFLFLLLLLASCATNIAYSHAELVAEATDHPSLRTLERQVSIKLDTGYSRTLRMGSRWMHMGRLAQGQVYKPYNDVFTLEGANMHEAYLVVSGHRLVGFYLPVERGFSPLRQTLPITFNQQEQ